MIGLGLRLASRLSDASVLRLAAGLGALLRWLNVDAVRVTRTNLALCMPELDEVARERLVRDSVRNMAMIVFEFARAAHWSEQRLLAQIANVHGEELLRDACAAGHGVLLLVPHFGNWELMCAYLGVEHGFSALYDPPKIAAFEPSMVAARQRFGGELFPIDTGGIRSLLRALKQGRLVAILPDQVPEREAGVYADFFKQPALTMTLVHRLIEKHQPTVLMAGVARHVEQGSLRYEIYVEPLPGNVRDADAATVAAIMNRGIEQMIARAPEQYQWEYKRFKRPPNYEIPNVYRRQ